MGIIANNLRKPEGFVGKLLANMMIKGNSPQYDRVIRAMKLQGNEKILEIGFGHGVGIKRICDRFQVHYTGIDFSPTMLTMAAKRNQKHIRQGRVVLHLGDFLEIEVSRDSFDILYCINVVYFWNDLSVPFSKIHASLKKDGRFLLTMAHRDFLTGNKFTNVPVFNKYDIETVVEELKKAGFGRVEVDFDKEYLICAVRE